MSSKPQGVVLRWVAHEYGVLGLYEIEDGRVQLLRRACFDDPRIGNGVIQWPEQRYRQQAEDESWPHWDHPEGRWFPPQPTEEEVLDALDAHLGIAPDLSPRGADEGPDEFYRRIAEAYRFYAPRTGKPLVAIAGAMGVPKTRVVNWVTQARRRGHLPPTEKGRANA